MLYGTIERSPQHVALQLPDGRWTSKLGALADIEHEAPDILRRGPYGQPLVFLMRVRPTAEPPP